MLSCDQKTDLVAHNNALPSFSDVCVVAKTAPPPCNNDGSLLPCVQGSKRALSSHEEPQNVNKKARASLSLQPHVPAFLRKSGMRTQVKVNTESVMAFLSTLQAQDNTTLCALLPCLNGKTRVSRVVDLAPHKPLVEFCDVPSTHVHALQQMTQPFTHIFRGYASDLQVNSIGHQHWLIAPKAHSWRRCVSLVKKRCKHPLR